MQNPNHDIKLTSKSASTPTDTTVSVFSDKEKNTLAPKSVRKRTVKATTEENNNADVPRWLTRILTILAYGIPLAFLTYVLYINYLPFGYNKTFTIDVGSANDTTVGEFYLEPSPDLSERKTNPDGTTYRELNGIAKIIFKPNVVLKNAEITVSVEGEGVQIIPPVIDFNPDDYDWDYAWDFTKKDTAFTPKVSDRAKADWKSCTSTAITTTADDAETADDSTTAEEICEQIPVPDLTGNAFWFDGGINFNGTSRIEMPGTEDMFEDGTFTVYLEWVPTNLEANFQQIFGHYNWEIVQNTNSVIFQVGRMGSTTGAFYNVKFSTNETFLNKKHSLLAVYSPDNSEKNSGYIELYVDNNFAGRTLISNDNIWKDYQTYTLSLGKSNHGQANYYVGSVQKIKFKYIKYVAENKMSFLMNNAFFGFSVYGSGNLDTLFLNANKANR